MGTGVQLQRARLRSYGCPESSGTAVSTQPSWQQICSWSIFGFRRQIHSHLSKSPARRWSRGARRPACWTGVVVPSARRRSISPSARGPAAAALASSPAAPGAGRPRAPASAAPERRARCCLLPPRCALGQAWRALRLLKSVKGVAVLINCSCSDVHKVQFHASRVQFTVQRPPPIEL